VFFCLLNVSVILWSREEREKAEQGKEEEEEKEVQERLLVGLCISHSIWPLRALSTVRIDITWILWI
jgi:hypothetical protein